MHTPADPKDNRSRSRRTIERTALEIQHDCGIICVYGRDGSPLLKITGLPIPVPEIATDAPSSRQLTIEIVSIAGSSEWGPYLGAVQRPAGAGENTVAASEPHPNTILKQAGATVAGFKKGRA